MHNICHTKLENYSKKIGKVHALRLSLRPLLALRIAFRECDVFFLGTASKNGGNNSSNESSGDAVHLKDVHVDACGKKDARFGRRARAESATVMAMTVPVVSVRTSSPFPFRPVTLHRFPQYRGSQRRRRQPSTTMFRLTRPVLQAIRSSTGLTGLAVHPNPLPELTKAYESTLNVLSTIPETSVYRQGVEALTRNKLRVIQEANGDVAAVEKKLDEGLIEQALDVAKDELSLVSKMIEWKA